MPGKPKEALTVQKIIADHDRLISREENDETQFDGGPDLATNRGNKLKRKAAWAHEGRLAGTNPYKKRINHAGFDRSVVHTRPRRYDEEGIPLDSDEEDMRADIDRAERDPYHDINVQALLMPITQASDLWQHPGMSHAYTNEALSDMVVKSRESLRKERKTLVSVKALATKFRGDHSRVAANMVMSSADMDLYNADEILRGLPELALSSTTNSKTPDPIIAVNVVDMEEVITNGIKEAGAKAGDVTMDQETAEIPATITGAAEVPASTEDGQPVSSIEDTAAGADSEPKPEAEKGKEDSDKNQTEATQEVEDKARTADADADDQPDQNDETTGSPVPRMVTRGAAAAANGTSTHDHDPDKPRSSSPQASLPAIHPAFIPPISSIPNRDLGMPPWEAEETRKLINVFVQKQEEVVRGAEKLYDMFLKANRLRQTVYLWSRAEEHAGEMSDGEEWVDQQEWELEEPLRKGKDDGEDEGNTEEKKGKGRSRRNAA